MSANKRIIFIVNPLSGTSGKNMAIQLIEKHLDKSLWDYDIVKTGYIGHATEIAREAARHGVDVVCAVGGDGTVNETARGLIHTQTALGIIPAGSGNGLARHLHIPIDTLGAIKVLNAAHIEQMDYGVVNNREFFCTCGVGFDAFISKKFAEAGKRGPLTYIENVLKSSLQYNPETYEIEIISNNGEEERHETYKAFLISCANASQYGNNAYIAPLASVRDGLLDFTIIEPFNALEAPAIAMQLFDGTIERNSRIKTFRGTKAIIRRKDAGVIHYDGDPLDTAKDISVELVPKGLLCVCPMTEGVPDVGRRVQGFFTEHFFQMYTRSEELFQENIRKTQRITKLNIDILNKLSHK